MTLKTRKPTGRTGWPKILLEGGDKSGKSYAVAELSASPRVGRTVVMVLGEDETKWDEMGKIPGARFELAIHDGSWVSMVEVIEGAKAEAAAAQAAGELPFVFAIDTVSAIWDGLGDQARQRARSSKKNRAILADDPNAEIDVAPVYWNDRRALWRQGLIRHVLTFPGIVVMVARGNEVALFENGQPVANKKSWSVEADKNIQFDASAHIRLSRDARPLLVSLASVTNGIRPGEPARPLPKGWSLDSFIFDTIGLNPANVEMREFTEYRQELTPEEIRAEIDKPGITFKRVHELYQVTYGNFPGVVVEGDDKPLLQILRALGDELRAAEQQGQGGQRHSGQQHQRTAVAAETPAQAVAEAGLNLDDLGDWADLIDGIASPDDEDGAVGQVDEASKAGRLDDIKAGAIRRAIKAKVAQVTAAQQDKSAA